MITLLGEADLKSIADLTKDIPHGEVLICGTFQGGDVKLFRGLGFDKISVIDSFAGLAQPTEGDKGGDHLAGEFCCGLDQYKRFLDEESVKHPQEIHEMWITKESLKSIKPRPVSLVWMDLDHYQPTLDCMTAFWDWLVPGGVMLTHDYGNPRCPGVLKACVEVGGCWRHSADSIGSKKK